VSHSVIYEGRDRETNRDIVIWVGGITIRSELYVPEKELPGSRVEVDGERSLLLNREIWLVVRAVCTGKPNPKLSAE
jgi:hypothetical protein